jgi:hypothetical protein
MTTDHLDDDALSAALDGAATAAEMAHLSSCSACQARQASLAAVARAVGAPVPRRSGQQVDEAVAVALAAWSPRETGEVASPAGIAATPGTARRPPTLGPRQPALEGARRRRGAPRWLPAAAGIAAAVVILGGVVALTRNRSASRSTIASQAPPATAAASAPSSASSADLGDQSDPVVVARLVDGALSRGAGAAAAAAAPAPSAAVSSVAPRVAQNQLPPLPACANQARDAVGLAAPPTGSSVLSYVASLRWLGQPGVVVVFSGPAGLSGAVMKTADCSVLAILPL